MILACSQCQIVHNYRKVYTVFPKFIKNLVLIIYYHYYKLLKQSSVGCVYATPTLALLIVVLDCSPSVNCDHNIH